MNQPGKRQAIRWIALATLLSLALGSGCTQRPIQRGPETLAGTTMGTTYAVKFIRTPGLASLSEIGRLVDQELEAVNAQMSTYRSDSELSRFNASQSMDWFPVSSETASIVQLSLEIHQRTSGRFDVTVGPLVNLWGFGPPNASQRMPSEEEIRRILAFVGSEKLEVRADPPALRKKAAELQVDLSAIAKGHGVDRVAELLDGLGVEDYMVEIGGEIRAKGKRADGRFWQVGIELPDEKRRDILRIVGLSDLSMATSGDYRNQRTYEGQKFSHFIDPQTGRPARTEIASATVLADNCALADALATGLMSSEAKDALELIETNRWAALLVLRKDDRLETIVSPSFEELLTKRVSTERVSTETVSSGTAD
jgi:FAD:protein FMN transferase